MDRFETIANGVTTSSDEKWLTRALQISGFCRIEIPEKREVVVRAFFLKLASSQAARKAPGSDVERWCELDPAGMCSSISMTFQS